MMIQETAKNHPVEAGARSPKCQESEGRKKPGRIEKAASRSKFTVNKWLVIGAGLSGHTRDEEQEQEDIPHLGKYHRMLRGSRVQLTVQRHSQRDRKQYADDQCSPCQVGHRR